jgi:hypothetical protein
VIKLQVRSKSLLIKTLLILLATAFCVSAMASKPEKTKPPKQHETSGQKRPQLPMHDFEWKGVFKGNQTFKGNRDDLAQPAEVEQLTVQGKWQTGEDGKEYFNLYMSQGDKHSNTWVENFVYENRLYTMTRKWHVPIPDLLPGVSLIGKCIRNEIYNKDNPWEPLPITVKGFNEGLASSRLVGVEKIDGKPMNHFRHTCLSKASPQLFLPLLPFDPASDKNDLAIPFKAFSDIYVPVGQSYPWAKWLQYGDGVGPDPQQDEWFLADRFYESSPDIVLPEQCELGNEWIKGEGKKTLIITYQTTCTNLVPAEENFD